MKKVKKYLNVFRRNSRAIQDVGDEIQISFSFITYELQTSIENYIYIYKYIYLNERLL